MTQRIALFFCFFITSYVVKAQEKNIPIGQWRVHLPYYSMQTLGVSPKGIIAAKNASVCYFDKEENAASVYSRYNGLNDLKVSKIGYNPSLATFLLGYETGNIDAINGNTITNINDILRSSIAGSKKINHFFSYKEFVYISGDFGVTLYNLQKKEVKESYLALAPNSSSNAVYASSLTSDKDSIFLATAKGVMAAKVSQAINLLDFSNWYTFQSSDSIDTLNVTAVAAHAGLMYASVDQKGIYFYNGNKWRKTSIPINSAGNIRNLTVSGNKLLACLDSAVIQINSPSSYTVLYQNTVLVPMEAYYDEANTLWIASRGGGIVQYKNNTTTTIYPDGPFSNVVFNFAYYNNNLVELAGGCDVLANKSYYGDGFSTFEDNSKWQASLFQYPSLTSSYTDFIGATYNPNNSTFYVSSYGEGLIAIDANKTVTVYNTTNSPLKKDFQLSNSYVLTGVTDLDNEGNLWVPTKGVQFGQPNLHKLSASGVWTSYVISSSYSEKMYGVTIDDNGYKWIVTKGVGNNGIIVFDEKNSLTRTLSKGLGSGNVPDVVINCITKDKKGTMYIGTNTGIAVCYDPSSILTNGADLTIPFYDGFPLLYERKVLAIEVDGANRKWIGTNDGLWLFNEDLTQVINFYNYDNSPLLSSYINCIKVQEKSGEVFFGTTEGITSVRHGATESSEKEFQDVIVFPNPVKPGFNGYVGISGLATDGDVKITDAAGNLFYQTKAAGGTATWNVRDYYGRRAPTGVYLIFATSKDGSAKFVSKIAVVE